MEKSKLILITIFFSVCTILSCTNRKEDTSDELIGLKEKAVIKIKGIPQEEQIFVLSDSTLLEYRYGLLNLFPKGKRGSKEISIKEMIWKENNQTSVIWFEFKDGSWISIETLKWDSSRRY